MKESGLWGKKIFVSYKFADNQVENLSIYENSTVRDYVTKFEEIHGRVVTLIILGIMF